MPPGAEGQQEYPVTAVAARRGLIQSAAMQEAVRGLQQAIASMGGVLLCGESGTGRETFARAIHFATHDYFEGPIERLLRACMHSAPSSRAFVTIDCAASQGLELRLFGCDSPARDAGWDGLDRIRKDSAIHQALNGTLFLRQLADMPGGVQARLARILRDGEAVVEGDDGVGSSDWVKLRPIATLESVDFDERVNPDLRKRLAQTIIQMPPLRERREDIPALVRYLLADICSSLGMPTKTASNQAIQLLAALPWRGNLTELANLLRTVALKAPGRIVRLADVVPNIRLEGGPTAFTYAGPLKQARERFEREYVAHVLEQHHGRIAAAARALGIQRTNLYRKLRQLAVQRRRPGRFVS